jgi:uncharacterized protein (TIGR02284 family)
MSKAYEVTLLNGLIKTTLDSMQGFRDAAEDARDTQFALLFDGLAEDRRRAANLMQERVREHGGAPEEEGSLLSPAHRTFMSLRDAFAGGDDRAIIEEVERGEAYLRAKFEEARNDERLSPSTLLVIGDAYDVVRRGQEWADSLRHNLA